MIHLPKDQRQLAEYLIQQSRVGNHLLFDFDPLRSVLRDVLNHEAHLFSPGPVTEEEAYSVEPYLERLMSLGSLQEQRNYLLSLEEPTLRKVIRTYFWMVENQALSELGAGLRADRDLRH